MKKNTFFEKYCIVNFFDADPGKFTANIFNKRRLVKSLELPKEIATGSGLQAAKYIASKIGNEWEGARIFEGRRQLKIVANAGSLKNEKKTEPNKQSDKVSGDWKLRIEGPNGGAKLIKVNLKKSPHDMSPSEIRNLVEKYANGSKWMRGSFVIRGFNERHFYNRNEKQIPIVGVHAITGIPV